MGLDQNLCFKGDHETSEKITHGTGETICKLISDKGRVSDVRKELLPYNSIIQSQIRKDVTRRVTREDPQMANKHMTRCSTSLVVRGNANRNHSKTPLHTLWNGCAQGQ